MIATVATAAAGTSELTLDLPGNIAFGILAVGIIGAALRVVTTRNIMHAALWLVVVLGGVGAIYLLLQAEFVAITQFLVYIGAIIVLFLFGIMLTKAPLGKSWDLSNSQKGLGAAVALLLLAVMSFGLISTFGSSKVDFAAYGATPDPDSALYDMDTNDITDEEARVLAASIQGAEAAPTGQPVEGDAGPQGRTQVVADSIFSEYLLPFEVISVLLLAALIGAIVIARKE